MEKLSMKEKTKKRKDKKLKRRKTRAIKKVIDDIKYAAPLVGGAGAAAAGGLGGALYSYKQQLQRIKDAEEIKNKKEGGKVLSGSELVASLYDKKNFK